MICRFTSWDLFYGGVCVVVGSGRRGIRGENRCLAPVTSLVALVGPGPGSPLFLPLPEKHQAVRPAVLARYWN